MPVTVTRATTRAAATVLVLALGATLVAGCEATTTAGDRAGQDITPIAPASTPASPATPATPATPASSTTTSAPAGSELLIRPGAVGEARVGMTRAEWSTTGLFADGGVLCEGELIHWAADPRARRLFVLTDPEATITQLFVLAPGPRTAHGDIQVGSTYGELSAAWSDLTEPVDDGFDQSSVYPPVEEDGLPYLGFLLDAPVAELTDDTPVMRIAVTGGEEAAFQYDC